MEKKLMMAESIRNFRLPLYSELPDVGLYLEQTIKYINAYLAPLGCLELTASMVSNYVKKGIIPNPVKKQYYAQHLAYLFFVAVAKQLVSIDNIALLISIQRSSYTLPVAYDYFCRDLVGTVHFLFGITEELRERGETTSEEKDLLHGLVFSAAHVIYMNAQFQEMRAKQNSDIG